MSLPSYQIFPSRITGQATAQAVPLSVKEAGLPVLPVWVAWKPMLCEPPDGMPALSLTLRAVTIALVGE